MSNPWTIRRLLATLAVLVAFSTFAPAGPAGAASNDVFSVEPFTAENAAQRPWFVYNVQAGQILQDIVTVQNFSDDELTLVLYASDGITIPGGGGFAPLREDETPTGAGTWVTLRTDEITLGPREGANIPFEVEVPPEAEPGDHAAVIVASDPEGSVGDPEGDLSLSVRNRVGSRVYIRVAGPIEPSARVDVLDVEHDRPVNPFAEGSATVTYGVRNTGNIRLSMDTQLTIEGAFGRELKSLPVRSFPDVLPDGVVVVTEEIDGLTAWEPLSARVSVTSPEYSTSRSTTFYPIPWPTVIVAALIISGLAGFWWWRRRRNRPGPATPPDDVPPEPERELSGAEA